jgi:DNA-binding beta-propeller fold protein YncE
MKKIEPLLPVLLSIGLILVLLYLGLILILMAFYAPGKANGFCMFCGPPPVEEIPHIDRLDVGAHGPGRVAVDAEGRFYITDPEQSRVIVTDANGQNTVVLEHCGYPSAIAVGPYGRIYLGDALAHAVWVLDPQGQFLYSLGSGEGEFGWPNDIEVDPVSGRVYVVDGPSQVVRAYDSTGAHLFNITGEKDIDGDGVPDTPPLLFPTGVAVDPSGLFVAISDHNAWPEELRVRLFDVNGNPSVGWILDFDDLVRPVGLAMDDQGNIYVADSFLSKVFVFNLDGDLTHEAGKYGSAPGRLKVPTDAALDPYGRLVVVSYNTGVLELYGPAGSGPEGPVASPAFTSLTGTPCFIPPPPNEPPVAAAGPDQVVNDTDGDGTEVVTLLDAGSFDPDGTIVSYEWRDGTTPIGIGSTLSVPLALGIHTIALVVTDNQGAIGVDQLLVIVRQVPEIIGQVSYRPDILGLSDVSEGQVLNAEIWLPDCLASEIDGSTVLLNGQVPGVPVKLKGKCKNDSLVLEVHFDRKAVANIIDSTGQVEFVVTGLVGEDAKLRASNYIEVVP